MFIETLDVDDMIAHLLVTEGFSAVEEVAFVPVEDLGAIEGFDEDVAEELRARAQAYLTEREEKLAARRRELNIAEDLDEIPGLTSEALVHLGEKGITTRDNLADLASDELLELLPEGEITAEDADKAIMAARAHWFEDDETDETSTEGEPGGQEGGEAEPTPEADEVAAAGGTVGREVSPAKNTPAENTPAKNTNEEG